MTDAGSLFVFSGQDRNILQRIDGANAGDVFGRFQAVIGDVLGDGSIAIASSAAGALGGAGRVFVFKSPPLDQCVDSDLAPTVVIDGCDSGVPNTLFDNGCSLSDLIADLAAGATNHGRFTSAVSHLMNDLKEAGLITGQQKGAIQSCAAGAAIPSLSGGLRLR